MLSTTLRNILCEIQGAQPKTLLKLSLGLAGSTYCYVQTKNHLVNERTVRRSNSDPFFLMTSIPIGFGIGYNSLYVAPLYGFYKLIEHDLYRSEDKKMWLTYHKPMS